MAQDFHINPDTGHWDDNYWANTGRYLAGQGGNDLSSLVGAVPRGNPVAPFSFDYNQAEQVALAKLAPYYKQMLELHNGNVEAAKQAIESDYATGKRHRASDYGGQMAQENMTSNDEQFNTLDDLNKRGVLFQEVPAGQEQNRPQTSGQEGVAPTGTSNEGIPQFRPLGQPQQGLGYSGLATTAYLDPMLDKQQQRRQAIQRAIQRQSDVAETNYAKDTADQTYQQKTFADTLAKQQSDEAHQMGVESGNNAYQKYQDTVMRSQAPYLNG